ncbi:MAG TPA: DUF3054 domain-containing protein [Propionibacteriaceae bacterium]
MQALRAAAADLAWVLLFAAIGRRSHAEGNDTAGLFDAGGLVDTAWPFLCGCLAGLLVSSIWRQPESFGTGVVVWWSTVTLGVALRLLSGDTAQLSFVVVAAAFLGLGMGGWRAVARVAGRATARRRSKASI